MTETTDPQLIEEIYKEIAPVKLDRKKALDTVGWSYGIKLYTEDPDAFVFYTCNRDFLKFGSYPGHVRRGAWYMDNSQAIQQAIVNYQKLYETQGEKPIAPPA